MENKGENGAIWSTDSGQEDNLSDDLFINIGNSNYIDQNGVEGKHDDSMEALPSLSRNAGIVGLDQQGMDGNQEDDVSESDDEYEDESGEDETGDEEEFEYHEDFGSPVVEDPQYSSLTSSNSSVSSNVRTDIYRASDLLMAVSLGSDPNRGRILQQAIDAMKELLKMATAGEPLWQRRGNNGEMEILNGLQYLREFGTFDATMEAIIRMVEIGEPHCIANNEFPSVSPNMPSLSSILAFDPLHIEASREYGIVNSTAINIVGFLMDPNQWVIAFSSIVARATLLGVLSQGADGSYDGMLQVMTAEFHQCTPLVPARQSYFARYCKQLDDRTWAVVDVSLESLFPYPQVQFRRRPSGCLIQEMPNGVSRVTWVEHVEVDNRLVHPIFQPIVSSGFAFGAKRWLAMLNRHCHWNAALMDRTIPQDPGALSPQPGRDSVLKLAWRMTRDFFMNVGSSTDNNSWMQLPTPISTNEDIRFRFDNHLILPGMPPSSTLVFTTSLRLPISSKILFDFLRDYRSRIKMKSFENLRRNPSLRILAVSASRQCNLWDLLSHERLVRELSHIRTGEITENRVSILQVKSSNKIEIMYLQENFTDETGSYVVYAPLDASAMTMIMNGGNHENTTILPSGFAILPDKPPGQGDEPVGSILTIAFKTADYNLSSVDYIPTAVLKTIDGVLTTTVAYIKDAVLPNHGS